LDVRDGRVRQSGSSGTGTAGSHGVSRWC
jgi:hypothetical protein